MQDLRRLTIVASLGAAFLVTPVSASRAENASGLPESVTKECGSCHMVFPPQMLPARSWTALMEGLASHFGENAALDEAKKKEIADYLTANAGDARGVNGHYLRGLSKSETPLRITETPYWVREHGEIRQSAYTKVQSKANCVACHKNAASGIFEGDDD
jgi:mono/diheme cytochrome c family protein